jgi:hypothetical protein
MPLPFTILFGGACGVVTLLLTKLLLIEDLRVALSWLKRRVKGPDPIDEAVHQ